MDKYIDEFCGKHFAHFEELGLKNSNDAILDNPRMRPRNYHWILLVVSILLILLPAFLCAEASEKVVFLKDVGVGMFASAVVTWWFDRRDKAIRYYEKVVWLIDLRPRAIREARKAANEHMMNVSSSEGLQLLQFTAQNAYEFAGYLDAKLGRQMGMSVVDGIRYERDVGRLSKEEEAQHIQTARYAIEKLLRGLCDAKLALVMNMLGGKASCCLKVK